MYKAIFICTFLFFFGHAVYSQAGIGTTTPDPNAVLELNSISKGLLLPQVGLTSTTAPAPLSAHVRGMFVYNTAAAGSGSTAVVPGIYVNDGTQWKLVSGSSANSAPAALNPVITGSQAVGAVETATYTYSDLDGDLEGTTTFQWYQATDNSGSTDVPIAGATSKIYQLASTDLGKYIRVKITPYAATGVSPGAAVYTPYVPEPVYNDLIRSKLSGSVILYDRAAVDDWVGITAAEYTNLQNVTGAAIHGTTAAGMGLTPNVSVGGASTYEQIYTGTYNAPLIPSGNYVFAFSLKSWVSGLMSAGGVIKTGTSSICTDVGSPLPAYNATSQAISYFVRKRPSTLTSSAGSSYLAFYPLITIGNINTTGTYWLAPGNVNNVPSNTAQTGTPQFQCLSTATRNW